MIILAVLSNTSLTLGESCLVHARSENHSDRQRARCPSHQLGGSPDPGALETEAPTSQASYTILSSEPTPRAPMIYPGLRAQPHTQPTPRRRRCGPGCWIVPLATAKPRSWRGTVSRHFDYVNLLQPACQVPLAESKFVYSTFYNKLHGSEPVTSTVTAYF